MMKEQAVTCYTLFREDIKTHDRSETPYAPPSWIIGLSTGTGSGVIGALQMITGSLLGSVIILLGGDSNIIMACGVALLAGMMSMMFAIKIYRHSQKQAAM